MTVSHGIPAPITGTSLDTKPTNVIVNSFFYETDTSILYRWNGSAWVFFGSVITGNDVLAYPYSTTIGDYSIPLDDPSAITASSKNPTFADGFARYADQTAADLAWVTNDTVQARVNITSQVLQVSDDADGAWHYVYHDLGSALSDTAWVMRLSVKVTSKSETNSRAAIVFGISSNTSDLSVAQDFIGGGMQVGSLTKFEGSYDSDGVAVTATNTSAFTFVVGTTYYFEIIRTSATQYVVKRYSDATYSTLQHTFTQAIAATVQSLRYIKVSSWNDNDIVAVHVDIDNIIVENGVTTLSNLCTNAIDDQTSTRYESASEVNPFIRYEMSLSADKEPAGIAIYAHANTTVTQFKIQTSPDGSTWTDVRLVNWSAITTGAYNYIRFNRPTSPIRYIRIYGNDGSAKVLAINELKVLLPTESQWNRRHGHKQIPASDASLALTY